MNAHSLWLGKLKKIASNVCGIYIIKNIKNNKFYIGKSNNIRKRWNDHLYQLKIGEHINFDLQMDWNIYGEVNFDFSVLEECALGDLDKRERYWINFLEANIKGYNDDNHMSHLKTHKKISDAIFRLISYSYNPECICLYDINEMCAVLKLYLWQIIKWLNKGTIIGKTTICLLDYDTNGIYLSFSEVNNNNYKDVLYLSIK